MTPQIWEAFNKIADYLVPVISVIASYFLVGCSPITAANTMR